VRDEIASQARDDRGGGLAMTGVKVDFSIIVIANVVKQSQGCER